MSDIKQHERKSRNEIFFYHIISSNIIFEKKNWEHINRARKIVVQLTSVEPGIWK